MSNAAIKNDLNHGHRGRLRYRLLNSKLGELPDYEILEMLLTFAHPRQDTKKLAKQLMSAYGSLVKILHSDKGQLLSMEGIGESVLATFRIALEVTTRLTRSSAESQPILKSSTLLINYCRATMSHLDREQMRLIFLNGKYMVIADELQDYGTVDQVSAYPREIVKRALHWNAAAIILVHNHPSGHCKPSKADISFTRHLKSIVDLLGIQLHDHLIITRNNHFSFKSCLLI